MCGTLNRTCAREQPPPQDNLHTDHGLFGSGAPRRDCTVVKVFARRRRLEGIHVLHPVAESALPPLQGTLDLHVQSRAPEASVRPSEGHVQEVRVQEGEEGQGVRDDVVARNSNNVEFVVFPDWSIDPSKKVNT